MTSPSERVKALVRSGSIAAAEGERLLAALGEKRPTSALHSLLRPFDRFGGEITTAVGFFVALACVATTRFGLDYDGAFDLHTAASPPSLLRACAEQALAWFVPAILFWLHATIAKHKARLIDFVGAVGFSRLPYVAAGLVGGVVTFAHGKSYALVAVAMFVIACVAVAIALLYQGIKSASGLRGAGLVLGFIGVLVVSEVISKLILDPAA